MINEQSIVEKKAKILRILRENMYVATGCTEPAAISYCASVAAGELKKLGDTIESIEVDASKNILKNAMSAGLPNTNKVGVNYAAGIGAIHGNPENVLNVNNDVRTEDYDAAEKMIKAGKIKVTVSREPQLLYIKVVITGKSHKASCIIADDHTNIVNIEVDGKSVFSNEGKGKSQSGEEHISPKEIGEILSVEDIVEFCDKYLDVTKDDIDILKKAEVINFAISEEGLKNDYGLGVGKNLKEFMDARNLVESKSLRAIMKATGAADARMAGAPLAVVANSGSGNQGITINVPVLSYAMDMGVSEETKYKAQAIANLISIYIKSKFGVLSAFCGAMIASIGAGCGITYLHGGRAKEISFVIQNMIGTLTGMICDGAKPDCSLKIYAGLQTAILSMNFALEGKRVSKDDGIVCENVENTINNVADVSVKCSSDVDDVILSMMLNK